MICLGIESTAHTFGISIVNDNNKKVLSNIIIAHKPVSGGLIPAKVADHHLEMIEEALSRSVNQAGIKFSEIGLIAFSQGPGIGHTLRIGAAVARSLSLILKKPLVGVNHCIAHLEIGRFLTNAKDPVMLYASGANTQIIAFEGGKYRVFGETLDLGIGNFLDSFARRIGLGFPGGPKIEE